MKEQPSYFAIIPANVRYSDISDRAKLLFGEITALAQKEGYCFASNSYFASAYNCTPQAISQHIATLEQAGFLRIEHNKSVGNLRKIWPIMDAGYKAQLETPIKHSLIPYKAQLKHNNTSIKDKEDNSNNVVFDENDPAYLVTTVTIERPDETPADLTAPAAAPKSAKKKTVHETAAQVREIVAHLNAATGSEFRPNTKATVQAINARLEEGYTVADFKEVIDIKAAQWKGDDKMQGYLRPETLFRPSHFEAYLQEAKRGATNSTNSSDSAHAKFLQYIETNYPALWKSSCRVFSLQEFQDYTNNTSLPGLSYHMTPDQRRAALILLLKELNESEKRRREVGNLFTGYLNHMRQALKNR